MKAINPLSPQPASVPSSSTSTLPETPDLVLPPPPAGAIRILVGIDVPASTLAEIEADWRLVADATRDAPDLVPDLTRSGLGRLQRLALGVSGVAVAEQKANPFARWVSAAA